MMQIGSVHIIIREIGSLYQTELLLSEDDFSDLSLEQDK
jgi:hypothetical protein